MEKKTKKCPFCAFTETEALIYQDGSFWRCRECGGISRDPATRLSPEAQRDRYLLHRNDLADLGYRHWLEAYLDAVLGWLRRHGRPTESEELAGLDFGSGPNPALVALVRERGYDATGWDPFFCAEPVLAGSARLVTCLEVSEHFETPRQDLARLADALAVGGIAAIATHLLGSDGDTADLVVFFRSWWYRQDPTHVSFYTERALIEAASSAALAPLGRASTGPKGVDILFFTKKPR